MKMPQQKPVGNSYYEYEELAQVPANNAANPSASLENNEKQNSNNAQNVFEEYLWMENEEEFDKEIMQQLLEQEECLEIMLEEEREFQNFNTECNNRLNIHRPDIVETGDIINLVENFKLELVDVTKSTLNPFAAEFVPDKQTSSSTHTE